MDVRACRRGRCLLAAVILTWIATPATFAYRVFLDYDDDDDLWTFRNLVEGPVTVPITLVVAIDSTDAGLTDVHFLVEWDCVDSAQCYFGEPHGDILWSDLSDTFPFSAIDMFACTGLTCECTGTRHFTAVVDTAAEGHWALGTLPFTRTGLGAGCEPLVYGEVEFRVQCSSCSYEPEDDPLTRMLLREGAIPARAATWGRMKALYR